MALILAQVSILRPLYPHTSIQLPLAHMGCRQIGLV
jgi:hypothetical protein